MKMKPSKCGCTTASCGCCEGTRKITPVSTVNRPGLDALTYRIGTHGAFFQTMKARLANMIVEAPGADGQTIETFYPLQGLTTRDPSDPAMALLDAWATVGDVLTFYQERIANEGYLRTATERRSLVELARLIGYKPRPGVASTVFLAYTLDDSQADPVEIPEGARSQSIPGPDELPQSFETSEKMLTRREWNNLQVRLTQPQGITLDNALLIDKVYVAGINTNLKTGDVLAFIFGETGEPSILRTVASVATQFEQNRTEITLQPLNAELSKAVPLLLEFVKNVDFLRGKEGEPPNAANLVYTTIEEIVQEVRLGFPRPVGQWAIMPTALSGIEVTFPALSVTIHRFQQGIENISVNGTDPPLDVTSPDLFVADLLKPRIQQPASSLQLNRDLKLAFKEGNDAPAQLLVNIVPELKDTFYHAWGNASLSDTPPDLKSVYVMRLQTPLFGANVPDQPTFFTRDIPDPNDSDELIHVKGELRPQSDWTRWPLASDEENNVLFLDQAHDEVLDSSYVVVQKRSGKNLSRQVLQVVNTETLQRTAYGMTGKSTRLTLADPWWNVGNEANISQTLRDTLVLAQSEQLELVDAPVVGDVEVTEETKDVGIVLDGLYNEFPSGRWVVLTGERTDIPSVTGVKGTELLMVSGLRQVDPTVNGEKIHTALLLATPTAYAYKRDTVKIYGNVVKATHGETTNETLGNGDGSQALQSFVLKQPPLTFVPAPNASGIESTLKIHVNNVEWHEAEAMFELGPRDRKFTTKTADDDKVTVIFGNGKHGSRLPTGVLNVTSTYRRGIGKPGNVRPEQVSLLQTKPLGVKSVINPLRASGGADKEDADMIRENAPIAVMALDRLVSLADYADFTRNFAGIGKVSGRRLSDGTRQFIHLTIAGIDDAPIDPVSDLYRNLSAALNKLGDVSVETRIESRELIVLVLSANISLQPDYLWEPVATEVRARLFEKFGFRKRALGQPALLCEIIACIQHVEGVGYVDVDAFGGVPERVTDQDGTRRLLKLDEISATVGQIVSASTQTKTSLPAPAVTPGIAKIESGTLIAAQLAIFTPTVPDTIVLNQIK
jgi:predicted phage baseplate assembly protein